MSTNRTFRRLVLMNEDMYKSALRCLEKDALAKSAERTLWYGRNGSRGNLQRLDVPIEQRMDVDQANASAVLDEPVTTRITTNRSERAQPVELVEEHAEEVEPETNIAHEESGGFPPVEETLQVPASNRKDIPEQYRKKYDALFRKLRMGGKFRVDGMGQVVLNGSPPIEGSNFHRLMRSMFVTSVHADNEIGRREFLEVLKSVGISHTEVSSKSARLVLLFGKPTQSGNGRYVVKGSSTMNPPGNRPRILRMY